MYCEQKHDSPFDCGETVRVEGRVLTIEQAQRIGFKLEPGLDGLQVVSLGFDASGNVTGMVPLVLLNVEADESKKDMEHFNEMLNKAAETARSAFGLEPTPSKREDVQV